MMTEDEAKTKWCPFVRVTASPEEWHTNRPTFAEVHNKGFDLCIGSACMAWRGRTEASSITIDDDLPRGPDHPFNRGYQMVRDDSLSDRTTTWEKKNPETIGFCGLAGKP